MFRLGIAKRVDFTTGSADVELDLRNFSSVRLGFADSVTFSVSYNGARQVFRVGVGFPHTEYGVEKHVSDADAATQSVLSMLIYGIYAVSLRRETLERRARGLIDCRLVDALDMVFTNRLVL